MGSVLRSESSRAGWLGPALVGCCGRREVGSGSVTGIEARVVSVARRERGVDVPADMEWMGAAESDTDTTRFDDAVHCNLAYTAKRG